MRSQSREETFVFIVRKVKLDGSYFYDVRNLTIVYMTNFRKKMMLYLQIQPST